VTEHHIGQCDLRDPHRDASLGRLHGSLTRRSRVVDAFFAALTEHEDGHVWIVHQWLDDSETSLLDNSEATIDAAFENLKERIQANSDEFDAPTKHGTERGCVIVVGAPGVADHEE
jgi:hypothetical protein